MNAIITKIEKFSSKVGVAYVKLAYLLADGTAGELFQKAEVYDAFKFDESKIFSRKELDALFASIEDGIVKIHFDSRGQCVGLDSN